MLEAVAAAESVIVPVPMAAMVVPEGIPAPVICCPTAMPVVVETAVTLVLPLVSVPLNAIAPGSFGITSKESAVWTMRV